MSTTTIADMAIIGSVMNAARVTVFLLSITSHIVWIIVDGCAVSRVKLPSL
jgi:hypothetical protein